jgi:hypothetical protein
MTSKHLNKPFSYARLFSMLIALGSTGVFFFITLQRNVKWLRSISLLVQFRPYISLPVAGVVFIFVLLVKNEHLRMALVFLLVCLIFGFSLAGVWANTQTENFILAGLMPRSDASRQYAGALHLLDYGSLSGAPSRRPFFPVLLAFILEVLNRNLQATIAVLAFLAAIGAWISTITIDRKFDHGSAVIYLLLVQLYHSRFVGSTLTENIGLTFGLLSLAMFLLSMENITYDRKWSKAFYLLGTLLFSVGQNTRPGAMVMLPLLVVFGGFIFRKNNKFDFPFAGIIFIFIMIPFLISIVHVYAIGAEGSVMQSNMAYGLYGFVSGGKGWNQILIDHPEITLLPIRDQIDFSFRLIFSEVIANPKGIMEGYGKEIRQLFRFRSESGFLSLFNFYSDRISILASILFILLCVLGMTSVVLKKKKIDQLFMAMILGGFLFSFPIAPPTQTQYMRVYALSMPFIFYFLVSGSHLVLEEIPIFTPKEKLPLHVFIPPFILSSSFVLFIFMLPLIISFIGSKPPRSVVTCDAGLPGSVVYSHPQSSIHIITDDAIRQDWVPYIHQTRFRNMSHNMCCGMQIHFYSNLSAPLTIFTAIENVNRGKLYVLADPEDLPTKPAWIQICGNIVNSSMEPSAHGFMQVETVSIIE